MDLEALGRWMVRRGALDGAALTRAQQRQSLYGGALDTALLELGLCDENTVVAQLAEASGLPSADGGWLESVTPEVAGLIDRDTARRLGAQPVAVSGDTLQMAVRFGADLAAVARWAATKDRGAHFRVVPEVRLEALWARLHGASVPTRFARLLGKLMGAEQAHRSTKIAAAAVARPPAETGPAPARASKAVGPAVVPMSMAAPPPSTVAARPPEARPPEAAPAEAAPAETAPVETAPVENEAGVAPPPAVVSPPAPVTVASAAPPGEAAILAEPAVDIVDDLEESLDELIPLLEATTPGSAERTGVLRRLRPFVEDPQLADRLTLWRQRVAEGDEDAALALGAIADRRSVPLLLDLLAADDQAVRAATLAGLRGITLHDFGGARWRWTRWWREFSGKHRVEWLLDALSADDPGLRLEAARELERLSGRYVGYHFDLDKRDRDEARRRWEDWWETTGKAGIAG